MNKNVFVEPDNEEPLTADASLAVIEAERDRVGKRVTFNPAVISGTWAVAWFVGFGCAYLAYGSDRVIPGWLGPTVAATFLIAAVMTSILYAARINSGISGPSRTSAAMYGWTWMLGFACLTAVNISLSNRDLTPATTTLLWSASSLLLVGVLQLAGGAIWRDRTQFVIGVWTMICATGAVLAGIPGNFLVQALAGGGGFAVLAVYVVVQRRRA
jgi:hypothetical protein